MEQRRHTVEPTLNYAHISDYMACKLQSFSFQIDFPTWTCWNWCKENISDFDSLSYPPTYFIRIFFDDDTNFSYESTDFFESLLLFLFGSLQQVSAKSSSSTEINEVDNRKKLVEGTKDGEKCAFTSTEFSWKLTSFESGRKWRSCKENGTRQKGANQISIFSVHSNFEFTHAKQSEGHQRRNSDWKRHERCVNVSAKTECDHFLSFSVDNKLQH